MHTLVNREIAYPMLQIMPGFGLPVLSLMSLLVTSVGDHGTHNEKLGRASLPSSERLVFSIIVVEIVRASFFTVCICGDRKVWRCQMMSC